jgi:small subunit ribosomal protein S26e
LQVRRVRCEASGVMVPKDKAIKRFIVRNIVDASAIRDIQDSSVFDGEQQSQQQLFRSYWVQQSTASAL